MGNDDWMQQLKQRKQQETGQALQQQMTASGFIVTFTLPPRGTEMSWFSQESPGQRYQRVREMIAQGLELHQQGRLTEGKRPT